MVQRRKRGVQARVVIENCSVEMPVAITKGMHVVAALVLNAEAKISGAWHKRLYNFNALPRQSQADV